MLKVTLQFPTVQLLWAFAKALKVHDFKINGLILICQCDEAIISEALTFYKAKIVQDPIKIE